MVLILSLLCVGRYGNAGQLAGHRWPAAWPTVAATAAAAVPAAAAAFLLLLRLLLRLVLVLLRLQMLLSAATNDLQKSRHLQKPRHGAAQSGHKAKIEVAPGAKKGAS